MTTENMPDQATEQSGPMTANEAAGKISSLLPGSGDGTTRDHQDDPPRTTKPEGQSDAKPAKPEAGEDDDDPLGVNTFFDEDKQEPDADPADGEQQQEPGEALHDDHVVEWDVKGVKQRATLAELRAGYLRQSDYTRKTQEFATEREADLASRQQAQQEWRARFQAVDALFDAAHGAITGGAAKPDPGLLDTDPDEYHRQKARFDQAQEAISGLVEQRKQMAQQAQADQVKQFTQWAQGEGQKLLEAVPEFADPKKGPKLKAVVRDALKDYGFSEEEIVGKRGPNGEILRAGLVDHRQIRVALDAARWRALSKRKGEVRRQVEAAPVMKPGSPAGRGDRQREQARSLVTKVRQTGDIRDAAAALSNLL